MITRKNMRHLIVANWKSNPENIKKAEALALATERKISKYRNIDIVVAPPFPFLDAVGAVLSRARLGAQDVWWADGPYTGAVSVRQVKSMGVRYVIIGHSERRIRMGEDDAMIEKKLHAALEQGVRAILCVGESERHGADVPAVVGEQLNAALAGLKKQVLPRLTIAYEPVWAISTSSGGNGADTPDYAFRARLLIMKALVSLFGANAARDVRVIYGGSVTSRNIAAFLTEGKMDGALVGRASLDPQQFSEIVRSAADVARS